MNLKRISNLHLEALRIILDWKEREKITSADIGKRLEVKGVGLGGLISSIVRDTSLGKPLLLDVGPEGRIMQYVINSEISNEQKKNLLEEINQELERRKKLLQ